MPRIVKPLTITQIKNAKPGQPPGKAFTGKVYKLVDGGGLYLSVYPSGGKLWHMKVKDASGKENRLSFGSFPSVTLEMARAKREEVRKNRAAGINPVAQRQAAKTAKNSQDITNSFEVIAREWFEVQQPGWAESHSSRVMARLINDVFPFIGGRAITTLKAPDYLAVFRRIEDRGAIETAHRVKSICGQVHRYAIATGRAESDPVSSMRDVLKPVQVNHFPAITDPKRVGELLRMIDGYQGTQTVRCALKLAPLLLVRPGELRNAKWSEIDWVKSEWHFFMSKGRKNKSKKEHITPLATQAVAILHELHSLTGSGEYLFPGERTSSRPISDNTLNAALRVLGIPKEDMTTHGYRAMARTMLDQELGERPDLIEHQLGHAVKGPLGAAYNRSTYLAERKRMMQIWADYLYELKNSHG